MGFKQIINSIDFLIFGTLINHSYPLYYRPKYGYIKYYRLFLYYYIPQKIFGYNRKVKWPVHFTSKVLHPEKITKGILCDPGDNIGNFINATNTINFGSNIEIGPGVIIGEINPNHINLTKAKSNIKIGNNVWLGANSVICKGVNIGSNITIGAGSFIDNDIPSNSVIAGVPFKIVKDRKGSVLNYEAIKLNKKLKK